MCAVWDGPAGLLVDAPARPRAKGPQEIYVPTPRPTPLRRSWTTGQSEDDRQSD